MNGAGKWVRIQLFRDCDYTPDGLLIEFSSQEAFLQFEEDRYHQGEPTARYENKAVDDGTRITASVGGDPRASEGVVEGEGWHFERNTYKG